MRLKFLLHLKYKRTRLWHGGAQCKHSLAVLILRSEACTVVDDEYICASRASSLNWSQSSRTGGPDPIYLPLVRCIHLLHTNTAWWFP